MNRRRRRHRADQGHRAAVQIQLFTTYDADRDIVRSLEAGATGALLKDGPREELFQAVRAAARG